MAFTINLGVKQPSKETKLFSLDWGPLHKFLFKKITLILSLQLL